MVTLGWVWKAGTLSPSSHKVAALISCDPPKTCTKMRSYIGAFKALSQCIPKHASLVAPLEDSIKGLKGMDIVNWTPELLTVYKDLQNALKHPHTVTIPRPSDKLVVTVDASPLNNGVSGTLFIVRNGRKIAARFFSVKLKEHQIGWMPCEHEALAIASSVNHFAPYIRDARNRPRC